MVVLIIGNWNRSLNGKLVVSFYMLTLLEIGILTSFSGVTASATIVCKVLIWLSVIIGGLTFLSRYGDLILQHTGGWVYDILQILVWLKWIMGTLMLSGANSFEYFGKRSRTWNVVV